MLGAKWWGSATKWMKGRRGRLAGLLLIFAASGAYAHSRVRVGVVCGDSMKPTYESGALYTLDAAYYRTHTPQRGDVVVFKRDGDTYIKRVAAGPGDTIYLLSSPGLDDEVVMDWQLSHVRRVQQMPSWRNSFRLRQRRVPAGMCYVLGDNLLRSMDSRHYGPIPMECIEGRVVNAPPPGSFVSHVAFRYGAMARL